MTGPNRRRIAGEQGPRARAAAPPVVPARKKAPARPKGQPAPSSAPAPDVVDEPVEGIATKPKVPSAVRSPKSAALTPEATIASGAPAARFPVLLTVGALVALVGGLAMLVMGLQVHQQKDAGEGPADAAQVAISTIDTFDYLDMKGHDERSMRLMTEAFSAKKKSWQPLTATQAEDSQAQGAASVLAAATMWCSQDCSENRMKVLVFYDQQLSAKGFKAPKVASQRAILTMVRQDGRWLVDGIERIKSAELQ